MRALSNGLQSPQFAPVSLSQATLIDPMITMTPSDNLTFTLSARGGVAAFAWIDHPAATVGYFRDVSTNDVSNGFFLIPGIDRTCEWSRPGNEQGTEANFTPLAVLSAIRHEPGTFEGRRRSRPFGLRSKVVVEQYAPLSRESRQLSC